MKKNIFEMFLNKVLDIPFWIKQVLYLKLAEEMQARSCEDFLREHKDEIFSTFIPTLTFKGKTELAEHRYGLDTNIYNFLQGCADGYSMIEISVNNFLSMEEVAKYYELCLEQNFIKTTESKEIHAMAGYIAGKFRIGEYFKHKEEITVDDLQRSILAYRNAQNENSDKKFGEIMIGLGLISEERIKSVLELKKEAKKRFILDYTAVPQHETTYSNDTQKFEDEITKLKDENIKLKRKMLQLLELVKKNAQQ